MKAKAIVHGYKLRSPKSLPAAFLVLLFLVGPSAEAPSAQPARFLPSNGFVEAQEISSTDLHLLPRGKEADGIIGDFLLRNGRIHALISASLPSRKANYATQRGYVTPGCLYDLDFVGADNDQLTVFRPGGLGGSVSYVRIVQDGSQGIAAVEAVRTAAMGNWVLDQFLQELKVEVQAKRLLPDQDLADETSLLQLDPRQLNKPLEEKLHYLKTVPRNLFVRHEYRLEPTWRHLLITSTYRNHGDTTIRFSPGPLWNEFSSEWRVGEIRLADSMDPQDRRAYSWMPLSGPDLAALENEVQLAPDQEKIFSVALTVGDFPLAVLGTLYHLGGETGIVKGLARDSTGQPVAGGTMVVQARGMSTPAYLDSEGAFSFRIPPGEYLARLEDLGRPSQEKTFSVPAGGEVQLEFTTEPAAGVRLEVRDPSGSLVPCRVQFIGINGTLSPRLGPDIRAQGCRNLYFLHTGRFTQQLPPGEYLIRVTRGPEYELFETRVELLAGQIREVAATLRRTVETRGWISADFHGHTTESGDNHTGIPDRIMNLVAEHVEFAPATEHNRFSDWQPYIDALGLGDHLKTVVGIELTRSAESHLNAFPFTPRPFLQDGGAPSWQEDPRLNAIVLRDLPGGGTQRWVHLNHPIVGHLFNDRDRDGIPEGGYAGLELLIDALEARGEKILDPNPWYTEDPRSPGLEERQQNRTFGWLQLLNQGRYSWIIAVSDSHSVCGNGAGGWRTYVQSSTDEPGRIDPAEIVRNARAGRMMVTNGPFLEVTAAGGSPVGSTVVSPGFVDLNVRVQSPNWIDVDRVQILVNGRALPEYNFTRASHPSFFREDVLRFEESVRVVLQQDAHLIVVATGENTELSLGWGESWQANMSPLAFTNPIFVDTDGKGFQPSRDSLDHPLLVTPDFPQIY